MKKLDLKQNTPEWEDFRKLHIGASDIGILMAGTNREIYELLQIKRGVARKFRTAAMKHGTDTEHEAIEWLVGAAKASVEKTTALMDAPDDWLMASFDYIDEWEEWLAEIKCPMHVFDTVKEHAGYEKWWWQVQAQLAVSGYSRGLLVVYHSPSLNCKTWVERDEDAINMIKIRGLWFYEIMVNYGTLPPPAEIAEREDEDTMKWAARYKEIDEKIKELEEEKEVLREEGIALASELPFFCNGVKVTKIANKETIDYVAMVKEMKIDVAPFKKTPKCAFTWRISSI